MHSRFIKLLSAVAIITVCGLCVYLYFHSTDKEPAAVRRVPVKTDGSPGRDKAFLILSNGITLALDDVANGKVDAEPGATIIKKDGRLNYRNDDPDSVPLPGSHGAGVHPQKGSGTVVPASAEETGLNTLSTPVGGQYQLTLPDGTLVWLNSASSITYPVAFTRNKREVKITGEVYFEVAKDATKPFSVKTYRDIVKVLGTQFNVNSYDDERFIKTSLLQGSVQINFGILQPGEAYENGLVIATNVQQDIAWKNGSFDFNNVTVEEAMKQITRWYGVEIQYDAGMPTTQLTGEMSRQLPLQELVSKLQGKGAHFAIDGNILHVML